MNDLLRIRNYIIYLKTHCGLYITLHPLKEAALFGDLLAFNLHDNSYCIYLKTCREAQGRCVGRQGKILERCKGGSFVGTCFAGVKEFVYPFRHEEEVIGFVSVSGYKTENSESYLARVSQKYTLPLAELSHVYESLIGKIPNKEEIDTLLCPLVDMIELFLLRNRIKTRKQPFAERVEQYIRRFHNRPITSREICAHFSCSRSYLSAEFNRYTGKSIPDYIRSLRIEDAKMLLLYSRLNITEIAYSVGFTDSNYFSGVFKAELGISPREYRQKREEQSHIQIGEPP